MQFFYHKHGGEDVIFLEAQDFHYLFHVRRFKSNETLKVRNLIDNKLYFYKHRKKEIFDLESYQDEYVVSDTSKLHLIMAVIDTKDIYDILSQLNALNVRSLNLFYADFSQKNRRLDEKKMRKIIYYSCMQCGRIIPMQIYIFMNLNEVLKKFPKSCYIDFDNTDNKISFLHQAMKENKSLQPMKDDLIDMQSCRSGAIYSNKSLKTLENLDVSNRIYHAEQGIIIGAEGGFSQNERENILQHQTCYALKAPYILTTHLVGLYIASLCV